MDVPHRIVKRDVNMLREADKVRMVLVIFAGTFLVVAPAAELPFLPLAWVGLALATAFTVLARGLITWERLDAAGRLPEAMVCVLIADLLWLTFFIGGTGGFTSPFLMLLLVVILFAGICFGSLPLALPAVTMTVVIWLTTAATAHGVGVDTTWLLGGQLITAVSLGWLSYALTAVLERERQTNAQVITQLSQGVLLLDEEGRVIMTNTRGVELLGLPPEEILGVRAEEVPAEGRTARLSRVLEDVQGAESQASARLLALSDDPPCELRLRTVPFRAGSQQMPLGWVVLLEDLTDVRAAARVKEESLAIVSHELRSPLAALRAASEVLTRMDVALTDEQRTQMLGSLATEIQRLSEIVTKLLDVSALEGGRVALQTEEVEVEALVLGVARSLWARAAARQIEVRCEVQPDLPPLRGDRMRLAVALSNLGENALKYTPDGGTIVFRARAEEEKLHLSVSDSGLGIPPEEQQAIFEKFTRGSSSQGRGRALQGLGLGLYVTRRVVEMHQGEIAVRSQVGVGSTFEVTLPLEQAVAEAA